MTDHTPETRPTLRETLERMRRAKEMQPEAQTEIDRRLKARRETRQAESRRGSTDFPGGSLAMQVEDALRLNQPETYRQLKASGDLAHTLRAMTELATNALVDLVQHGVPYNQAMEIVRAETFPQSDGTAPGAGLSS